ncbi:MAG: hypothetical protein ABEJ04_00730 [Halobacteriaceae archaeon]
MDITSVDVSLYIYNVAVVVSGGFLVSTLGIEDRFVILGIGAFLGLVWTVYFKIDMARRFESPEDSEDERRASEAE